MNELVYLILVPNNLLGTAVNMFVISLCSEVVFMTASLISMAKGASRD